MRKIVIHSEHATDIDKIVEICPFGAIECRDEEVLINSACKMCGICVKQCPRVFEFIEMQTDCIDKSKYKGIAVYIDHTDGEIHPVSFELIGKALELGLKLNHPVHAIFMGHNITDKAKEILKYGIDEVFVYDQSMLEHFRIEPYTAVFEDYINNHMPSIVLVGGTTVGRSLAPRVAARFKTGLTADCTILDVQENTDLDQIRPAFGGNIMAHIHTPNNRPQFATVRYKIFDAPNHIDKPSGSINLCHVDEKLLTSKIKVLGIHEKEKSQSIEDAQVVVVVGSGFKKEEDLQMAYDLASRLGAKVASTRPLIEKGWMDAKLQIGLSGRTVRPKLIITCGVSGAIQFIAGMQGSENIFAINTSENAPIFDVAHYGIVGDIYEIIPDLIDLIDKNKSLDNILEVTACQ